MKNQLTLFDDKPKPEQERAMYISKNTEANFADFLQLHKTADNTMFEGNFIRDYTDGWGLKLLKKALFVFDKEENKWYNKVPNNYRNYQLMMIQFKKYGGEQI